MTEQKKPEYADVYAVLHHIQKNLKAPKTRHNKFGGYNYRNAEDILDGIKEVMPEGAAVIIQDDIRQVGDRYYVQAVAKLIYKGVAVENCAYAREPENKKGADESQVTGASSSYARKYALNGLFMIDDTQDADATNKHGKTEQDQKALDAMGGSVTNGISPEDVQKSYEQGLKALTGCNDLAALKKAWEPLYKGRKVFSEAQWQDLEDAKEAAKFEIENKQPF